MQISNSQPGRELHASAKSLTAGIFVGDLHFGGQPGGNIHLTPRVNNAPALTPAISEQLRMPEKEAGI
jgi:hypothetical protein